MIIYEMLIITKSGKYKLRRFVYNKYKKIMKDLDSSDIIPDIKDNNCFGYSFTTRSNYIIYNTSENEFEYFVTNNVNIKSITFDNIIFFNIPLKYRTSDNINKILYPLYYIFNDNYIKLLSNITKQEFCVFNLSPTKNIDTIITSKEFRHVALTKIEPEITKRIYSIFIPFKYHNRKNVDYIQAYSYGFFTISIKLRVEFDNMQIRVLDKPEYYINNEKHDKPDEIIKILEELKKELTTEVVAKEFEDTFCRELEDGVCKYNLHNSQRDILKLITLLITMVEACETFIPNMIIQKLQTSEFMKNFK